jgi:hypothetical protein
MKLDIFTSSLVLVLPINVIFGDFTAFFVVDFFGADVFAAEDILSNKKGCWQPGLSSVLSVTECLVTSFSLAPCSTLKSQLHTRQ